MGAMATIGLDLAKNVFQVHGVATDGKVLVRRQLRRGDVLKFFENLSPCLMGMEACATAHHWARAISALGHTVKMMPPAYVKPYVKRGKTDAADAEVICEAVTRPAMRLVAVKTQDQQGALMLHKTRDLLVRQRTMLVNGLRGQLAEFGTIAAKGPGGVKGTAIERLEVRILGWHRTSDVSWRRASSVRGGGRVGAMRCGRVSLMVLLALVLFGLAACAGLDYTGPPEENNWEQNSHGHPG